ncbi:MAG: Gfo/Idh/MocA family oxidoreductase [Acidobacteria bacterium]|nr:Gfo/Idh/MocA family oxidoreductase [Acidobacteriota bacterium]
MDRRSLVTSALAAFGLPAAQGRKFRVAIIGHTGQGNYGHGMDVVWQAFEDIDVVAVADADEAGLAQAAARTGAENSYRDYREMLRAHKVDLVAICPRTTGERVPMVEAAASAGAHIYMEKPFAGDLAAADRLVAAVRQAGVKLQVAHQFRCSPFTRRVQQLITTGAIGVIQEIRARGKEDRRAGGEDLLVLGSHLCDAMRLFLGNPQWASAHVTQDGDELSPGHVHPASEPVGPVAGNQVAATFAFNDGVHSYLSSRAAPTTHPYRYSFHILGSQGAIFIPMGVYPADQGYLLRSPSWMPLDGQTWEKIPPAADPLGVRASTPLIANALMVADLLQAIQLNRKPACSEEDGRWTIEMISAVYEAQKSRGRVTFPLANRTHPLAQQSPLP